MFGLGAGELLLIFVIAILFLGPKKIPELAKGLGQALREFQKARDDMMTEINKPHPDTAKKADVEVVANKVESTDGNDGAHTKTSESPKHS